MKATAQIRRDLADLFFRVLFSSIFLGLGLEHLFSDHLIQGMMPDQLPYKRFFSIMSGAILLSGGVMVLAGWELKSAAVLLGGFLVIVTTVIHLPNLFYSPLTLPDDWTWLWEVYQRSNFVKNLCLLGVCIHLLYHRPGRFSLDARLKRRRISSKREERVR